MSHQVTSSIKKELSKFAERITPQQAAAGTSVPGKGLTGAELASQYGITTDSKGAPLNPALRYFTTDLPRVNHLRRLCKAYEVGGWPKVALYLKPFRTPAAAAREAAAATAAPVATVREFRGKAYEGALPAAYEAKATIKLHQSEVEALRKLQASPAVFAPLPEVAADAVATEVQVSMPVAPAPVREFTKLCQRWEKEADEAQAAA